MAGRVKRQPLGRQLIVELTNQRLQRGSVQPQPELGNLFLKKFLVAKCRPIDSFHVRHGITRGHAVTSRTRLFQSAATFINTSVRKGGTRSRVMVSPRAPIVGRDKLVPPLTYQEAMFSDKIAVRLDKFSTRQRCSRS